MKFKKKNSAAQTAYFKLNVNVPYTTYEWDQFYKICIHLLVNHFPFL